MARLEKNLTVARWLFSAVLGCAATACSNDHLPPPAPASAMEMSSEGMSPVTVSTPRVEPVKLAQIMLSSPVSSCHIDSMAAGGAAATPGTPLEVVHGSDLDVAGWIATADENAVPAEIGFRLLAIDGGAATWEFKVPTGRNRSDVAAFKGKPALGASGFAFTADLSGLQPGGYRVYLSFEHAGKAFSCNGGDTVSLVR